MRFYDAAVVEYLEKVAEELLVEDYTVHNFVYIPFNRRKTKWDL